MAVSIPGDKNTVSVMLRASRGGVDCPLPAGITVVSSDESMATVAFDAATGMVATTRVGFAAGAVDVTATAGALSASLHVDIEAAAADALAFDESTATTS